MEIFKDLEGQIWILLDKTFNALKICVISLIL